MSDEKLEAIEAKIDGLRGALETKVNALVGRMDAERRTDKLLGRISASDRSWLVWPILGAWLVLTVIGFAT